MDVWRTLRGKCFVRQSIFLFIIGSSAESLKTNKINNAYCFHLRVEKKIVYHYIISL